MKKQQKPNKKPLDAKLLGYLVTECFAVMMLFAVCVYGVGSVQLGKIVYFSYLIIGLALLFLAVGLNGGFDTEVPTPEQIVGDLTMEARIKFVEKIRARKEKAKKVMFVAFPFLLCLLFDTIYLMLPTGGIL